MGLEEKLKAIGDKSFAKTFESMQLLCFTALYYNFDYSTQKMIDFNKRLHEKNKFLLDDVVNYNEAKKKIENAWGISIATKVRQFPYRAKCAMIGGIPKGGMKQINMAMVESSMAIESYLILAFSVLMETNKRFGKNQMDLLYENIKSNSENYANGMKDEFIVQYFIDEIGLEIAK